MLCCSAILNNNKLLCFFSNTQTNISAHHLLLPKSKPFLTRIHQSMGAEYDYQTKSTAFDHQDMQIQPYEEPPQSMSGNFNKIETAKGKKKSKALSSGKKWSFSDPEFKRKKRVASYKVYAAEGRAKGTLRNSFTWLKSKCTKITSWW